MIKANELRIGNKFYDEDCTPYTWQQEDFDEFVSVDGNYTAIYPIPLTPEILEKAGFEYLNYYECYFIKTQTGEILLSKEYILQSTDTITKVEYLHQLQNLYFALCGEELDITFS